nr:hypothetical protein [Tanacetum cinerariifolium]
TAAPGLEIPYSEFATQAMPHYGALTPEGLNQDIQAAYDWLQGQEGVQQDKIGSIGFCLGGQVSFRANAVLPLAAAVSYYGGEAGELAARQLLSYPKKAVAAWQCLLARTLARDILP